MPNSQSTLRRLERLELAAIAIFAASLPFSVSLIQGGLLLFITTGILRCALGNMPASCWAPLRGNPLLPFWLAYLSAGALAAALGAAPGHSFAALNSDLLTAIAFFGLCLFIRPKTRDVAINFYLSSITLAAAWGIFQALDGLRLGLDIRAHAASHPVRFGEIMVIGLSLALSRASAKDGLSPWARRALYTSILVIISAIVLSQTRGAYLGTALVFAMFLVIKRPPKRLVIPLLLSGTLLGGGLSALNPSIRHKLVSIVEGASSAINSTEAPDQSIGTRLVLWETGLRMIKDNPVTGVGPANVKKLFPIYYPHPSPEGKQWGSLHNLYIHQAAERGLIGLAVLLALFGAMLTSAISNFRRAPNTWLPLWALAVMPAWFLMNVTEITFQHVHTSYAILLALAVSCAASEAEIGRAL